MPHNQIKKGEEIYDNPRTYSPPSSYEDYFTPEQTNGILSSHLPPNGGRRRDKKI
jgi:hypothetical protein